MGRTPATSFDNTASTPQMAATPDIHRRPGPTMAPRAHNTVARKKNPQSNSDLPETYATASDMSGWTPNSAEAANAIRPSATSNASGAPVARARASAHARSTSAYSRKTTAACSATLVAWNPNGPGPHSVRSTAYDAFTTGRKGLCVRTKRTFDGSASEGFATTVSRSS